MRSPALQQLRSPRWVTFTAVAIVVIVGFAVLSYWQWQRAQRDEVIDAAQPVAAVLTDPVAATAYGVPVTIEGRYQPNSARLLARGDQWWTVAALTADVGVVPVVLGASPDRELLDLLSGPVSITGTLQPYDGDPGTPSGTEPDEIALLTRSALQRTWSVAPTPGWVAVKSVVPANGFEPVTPAFDRSTTGGLRLQNASYAFQWLLFAGFIVFLWVRWFRDDLTEQST